VSEKDRGRESKRERQRARERESPDIPIRKDLGVSEHSIVKWVSRLGSSQVACPPKCFQGLFRGTHKFGSRENERGTPQNNERMALRYLTFVGISRVGHKDGVPEHSVQHRTAQRRRLFRHIRLRVRHLNLRRSSGKRSGYVVCVCVYVCVCVRMCVSVCECVCVCVRVRVLVAYTAYTQTRYICAYIQSRNLHRCIDAYAHTYCMHIHTCAQTLTHTRTHKHALTHTQIAAREKYLPRGKPS